jgi:amino acid transporter
MTANDSVQADLSAEGGELRHNALSARHIIFFVIAAAAPLGFAVGAIPLAIGRGGIGTAGMFIVVGLLLLVFAVGYVAMARHVRRAGGLYIYVTEGLGRTLGLGTAFVATLAYAIAATGAVGIFSLLMQSLLTQMGMQTPWVVWALLGTVLMGTLGILRVELNARVLGVVMLCEVGILLIVGIAVVAAGGAEGLSAAPFSPSEILGGNPGAMLAITISAFSGFEATVLFVEEVREPERSIPRATYGAIGVMVVLYAFVAWWAVEAFGNQGAVDQATNDPINMFFTAAGTFAGEWAVLVMAVLVVTSWFASILAFHNATSRYLLALGRDRALPHRLSAVHPRFNSPWIASLTHSVFTLIVVLAFAFAGLDPYLDLYVMGSAPAVIAIPLMECLAAIAILAYFLRDRHGMPAWRVIVMPILAAIGLAVVTYLIISQLDVFTARGALVNSILTGVVFAALIGGVLRALYLRARRPVVYEGLGSSNDAVSA